MKFFSLAPTALLVLATGASAFQAAPLEDRSPAPTAAPVEKRLICLQAVKDACAFLGQDINDWCICVPKAATTTSTTSTAAAAQQSCYDSSKRTWCAGQGYGCSSSCECTSGSTSANTNSNSYTSKVCLDVFKVTTCALFGRGVDANCNCNSCTWAAQVSCELQGGRLDSSNCRCVTGTATRKKRDATYAQNLCKKGETACRVDEAKGLSTSTSSTGSFECVDTSSNIDSCGGCVAEGAGQDCSAIPNVEEVACASSKCLVISCAWGFQPSADGSSCVVDPRTASAARPTNNRQKLLGTSLKGIEKFWGY